MVSRLCRLLCFLAVCISLGAQTDEPELISANIPTYPALAREARIQGTVKVSFTLPAQGEEPVNVEVVSGHPMLKGAAVENVKTWHFRNSYAVDRKYQTTFRYLLSEPRKVTFESFQNVEIVIPVPPTVDSNF